MKYIILILGLLSFSFNNEIFSQCGVFCYKCPYTCMCPEGSESSEAEGDTCPNCVANAVKACNDRGPECHLQGTPPCTGVASPTPGASRPQQPAIHPQPVKMKAVKRVY